MDQDLIDRYLTKNINGSNYYLCGPDGSMDAAEVALRELNVPWEYIYSERFNIV